MRASLMQKGLLFVLSGILPLMAWGHGEDRPGPNQGFVRMPGAYHVEVVPYGEHRLKVFLLDMKWKNASVKDSALSLAHRSPKKVETTAECRIAGSSYYVCEFPKRVRLSATGKLQVASQREGQKGMEVSYDLPLSDQWPAGGHGDH